MTEQEKIEFRQKWKKWIDKIGHDLGDLLISQDIFKEVAQIVASNKQIRSSPFFFTWIQNNYMDSIVVGLARLNDHDGRTISLHNLIKEIKENPEAITRDYFVSRYRKWMQEKGMADNDFNKFAQKNNQYISSSKLNKDIKHLDEETELIKNFRDQWVAHLDMNQAIKQLPTHNDVEKALEYLDEIFRRYYMLIDGAGIVTAKPALAFDWKEPLTHPWIEGPEQEESEG